MVRWLFWNQWSETVSAIFLILKKSPLHSAFLFLNETGSIGSWAVCRKTLSTSGLWRFQEIPCILKRKSDKCRAGAELPKARSCHCTVKRDRSKELQNWMPVTILFSSAKYMSLNGQARPDAKWVLTFSLSIAGGQWGCIFAVNWSATSQFRKVQCQI